MAKIIRCDNPACRKEQQLDARDLSDAPPTWLDIKEVMPGVIPNEHHVVCSRACAVAILSLPRDEKPEPGLVKLVPAVPDIPF